jgi:hypothetical protein
MMEGMSDIILSVDELIAERPPTADGIIAVILKASKPHYTLPVMNPASVNILVRRFCDTLADAMMASQSYNFDNIYEQDEDGGLVLTLNGVTSLNKKAIESCVRKSIMDDSYFISSITEKAHALFSYVCDLIKDNNSFLEYAHDHCAMKDLTWPDILIMLDERGHGVDWSLTKISEPSITARASSNGVLVDKMTCLHIKKRGGE